MVIGCVNQPVAVSGVIRFDFLGFWHRSLFDGDEFFTGGVGNDDAFHHRRCRLLAFAVDYVSRAGVFLDDGVIAHNRRSKIIFGAEHAVNRQGDGQQNDDYQGVTQDFEEHFCFAGFFSSH